MSKAPRPIALADIHIEHYAPQAGDVLVVSLPERASDMDAEHVKRSVRAQCGPDVGILIKRGDVDLWVLRAGEETP